MLHRQARTSDTTKSSTSAPAATQQVYHYTQIEIETQPGISIFNITPQIKDQILNLGVQEGFVNVLSRHTTTAIAINEYEIRLLDDIRQVRTVRRSKQAVCPSCQQLHVCNGRGKAL
jgi:hypothetical protein